MSKSLKTEQDFAQLYTIYSEGIYHLCRSYLNEDEIAKDLLQETFINIWKHREKFRGDSAIQTWIYRIAINTCLGYLRNEKRKGVSVSDSFLPTQKADDNFPEEEHSVTLLYQAIHELPETDRLIISMVLQEIPYEQIADTIGLQEGHLRVKIHRIKKQLAMIHSALQKR